MQALLTNILQKKLFFRPSTECSKKLNAFAANIKKQSTLSGRSNRVLCFIFPSLRGLAPGDRCRLERAAGGRPCGVFLGDGARWLAVVGSKLEESRMYAYIAPVIAAGNDAAGTAAEASRDASLRGFANRSVRA